MILTPERLDELEGLIGSSFDDELTISGDEARELIQTARILVRLELALKTSLPEVFAGHYFVCGEIGEPDKNGLPDGLVVCPAYGCDWVVPYMRKEN